MVRPGAPGSAGRGRHAFHPRTPGLAPGRHTGQMAGPIPPLRAMAAGICHRHARDVSPGRTGLSTGQNDAAPAGSWPDCHADATEPPALRQNGGDLARLRIGPRGRLLLDASLTHDDYL